MTQSTLHRRDFLTAGFVASAFALSSFDARGATSQRTTFLRPFRGSRTISSFAAGLFRAEDGMPNELCYAIDSELSRTDAAVHSVPEERRQAEFFAWLAMRVIAPRTLRCAGYESLATGCENERDFRPGGAAAVAQHAIGNEFRLLPMPRLAHFAYGACAHTSTCAFYAGHDQIETVIQTGEYLARALLEPFSYEDANAADASWIWNFAVATINAATDLSQGEPA